MEVILQRVDSSRGKLSKDNNSLSQTPAVIRMERRNERTDFKAIWKDLKESLSFGSHLPWSNMVRGTHKIDYKQKDSK